MQLCGGAAGTHYLKFHFYFLVSAAEATAVHYYLRPLVVPLASSPSSLPSTVKRTLVAMLVCWCAGAQ